MKKLILLITTATLILSCSNLADNEFEVNGSAKGIENGKKVYLELQSSTGSIAKDTAVVEDGKFKLSGTIESPELGFVRVETVEGMIPLILENGSIDIEIAKDTIQNSKISGTKNNDKFQEYNDESKVIYKKIQKFEKANQDKMMAARHSNDTITINALLKEYGKFQDEMNNKSKEFIGKNPDSFLSVLLLENFLMREYLPTEEVKAYYDKLDKSLLKTNSAKNIKKVLESISKIKIGQPAPDFSANTPDGKKLSLKESLGKVTIIDFWASWCGPCRKENPNVVALYNEYHSKGLNIIGVSLDENAADWKEAIAKDGLIWNQVSNLKKWKDPIANQYSLTSIPATFILDAKGNIVAKDLRGESLKAKVKELLGEK